MKLYERFCNVEINFNDGQGQSEEEKLPDLVEIKKFAVFRKAFKAFGRKNLK